MDVIEVGGFVKKGKTKHTKSVRERGGKKEEEETNKQKREEGMEGYRMLDILRMKVLVEGTWTVSGGGGGIPVLHRQCGQTQTVYGQWRRRIS